MLDLHTGFRENWIGQYRNLNPIMQSRENIIQNRWRAYFCAVVGGDSKTLIRNGLLHPRWTGHLLAGVYSNVVHYHLTTSNASVMHGLSGA